MIDCWPVTCWWGIQRLATALRAERGTTQLPEDAPDIIRSDNVAYACPGSDRPALDGVSLTLRRGQLTALVGENGSGKTTLAALLTGLRIANRGGKVTWDDTDLADTDLADADPAGVWHRVGLVPQHYTRWPVNLRENIHLGQPVQTTRHRQNRALRDPQPFRAPLHHRSHRIRATPHLMCCVSRSERVPQLTACFTSAAIRASTSAVTSVRAKPAAHIVPSSSFAWSLNPSVA